MNVKIEFKDKKNSSGYIKDSQIILYISSRLSREEQQKHIDGLTEKLLKDLDKYTPEDFTPSGIKTNEDLAELARSINDEFYHFSWQGIRFKKQTSRWGSCSTKTRQIYISNQMVNGPIELLEYLVTHELCHLKEPNHGPRFWQLVAVACPDYKVRRRNLKAYHR